VSRLASQLVQDAIVGVKAMEDALQRQAVFGGTLDTNLLEAGAIDEAQLTVYLARSTGLAAADAAAIVDARPEGIARSLAGQVVQQGGVPVELEGRTLQVLVTETADRKRLDDLGLRSGYEIVPLIAAEVRFHEALELLWNVAMPPRLAALRERLGRRARSTPAPVAEPERVAPGAEATAPADAAEEAAANEVAEVEPVPFHVEMPAFDPTPLSPEEAEQGFAEATDRDAVLEVFCRGLAARFRFAGLFMVHGDHAAGKMMVRGPFADREDIGRVSISLHEDSLFRSAVMTRRPQSGPVREDGEVLGMLGTLGHTLPPDAIVVPVEIRGRVVCLAYCDNNMEPIDPAAEPLAAWLAEQAAAAFFRLILAAKGTATARSWATPPPGFRPDGYEDHATHPAAPPPSAPDLAALRRTGQFPPRQTGSLAVQRHTGQFPGRVTGGLTPVQGVDRGGVRTTGAARVVLDLGALSAPEVARELVDRLEREDLNPQEMEYLRRSGEEVLAEIVHRFPGRLKADRHVRREPLPPPAQCGPVLGVLSGWREALPHLAALAQSEDVEKRFWATYLVSDRPFEEAYPTLVDRAFDPDPILRALATSSLRRFAAQPGFRDALARIHLELESSDGERQMLAVEAAGILRDPDAVPALIHHVGSDDAHLADAAQRALFLITRQDFGRKRRKWLAWYEHNQPRHQIEWLIEALGSKDEEPRRGAEEDLRLLTGKDFGYLDGSSRSGREQVQRLWLRWWQDWGRRAFGQKD
jgi:hypothetical protein